MRPLRLILILAPWLALAGSGAWYAARELDPNPARPTGGRLVVVVVFDQMRGDYLDRWSSAFGTDGFEQLKADGVWYADAHLPYATTTTAPGHASLATGVPPSVHGIVENAWFDRASRKKVYCTSGERPFERVPPHPDWLRRADGREMAPTRLLAPTVADRLRTATGGQGRVVSLAVKDRSAVLLGGREPTACYGFDPTCGRFFTSSYYREQAHSWVERFNATRSADRWFGRSWDRLHGAALYDRLAGPDDIASEGIGINGQGRTFPHPLSLRLPAPDVQYYTALENSPHANELLWDLAKTAIAAENLGRSGAADLLYLAFSANDPIGHCWGPDSHEVLDATLRSDRLLAEITTYLRQTVGADRFTVIVTADHGVCPLPELAARQQPGAGRFDLGTEFGPLPEVLDEIFGKGAAPWIDRVEYPWWYLNSREVEAYAAQWLGNRSVAAAAFTRTELSGPPLADPLGRTVQLTFHPDRSGDVYVVHRPYTLATGLTATGTTHGTPHTYDTHIPVLAAGAGIPKLGVRREKVNALLVAALTCQALGIDPPPGAELLPGR